MSPVHMSPKAVMAQGLTGFQGGPQRCGVEAQPRQRCGLHPAVRLRDRRRRRNPRRKLHVGTRDAKLQLLACGYN